jgi:hypothetical protein
MFPLLWIGQIVLCQRCERVHVHWLNWDLFRVVDGVVEFPPSTVKISRKDGEADISNVVAQPIDVTAPPPWVVMGFRRFGWRKSRSLNGRGGRKSRCLHCGYLLLSYQLDAETLGRLQAFDQPPQLSSIKKRYERRPRNDYRFGRSAELAWASAKETSCTSSPRRPIRPLDLRGPRMSCVSWRHVGEGKARLSAMLATPHASFARHQRFAAAKAEVIVAVARDVGDP